MSRPDRQSVEAMIATNEGIYAQAVQDMQWGRAGYYRGMVEALRWVLAEVPDDEDELDDDELGGARDE